MLAKRGQLESASKPPTQDAVLLLVCAHGASTPLRELEARGLRTVGLKMVCDDRAAGRRALAVAMRTVTGRSCCPAAVRRVFDAAAVGEGAGKSLLISLSERWQEVFEPSEMLN